MKSESPDTRTNVLMLGKLWRGVDAVCGHLHVNAVFDADGATRLVRPTQGQPGRHVNRLDAGCVQRRRVVDELAGPFQLGGAGDPVGVGFADDNAAVVGNLLFQRGHVGGPAPHRQADFEVLPIYK